jgi:hypothetical protein
MALSVRNVTFNSVLWVQYFVLKQTVTKLISGVILKPQSLLNVVTHRLRNLVSSSFILYGDIFVTVRNNGDKLSKIELEGKQKK